MVCNRLRDFMADLTEVNVPDAHTLRYSLLAAACHPDWLVVRGLPARLATGP